MGPVAPLPCSLEVTPLWYPIRGRQVVPPIVWLGVALRDVPGESPLPLDKGKGKIDEIKYPVGSEYLK